jgi:2-C-methyl-D-erythritol 2,4-cyclodiphosphate synthase
MNIRVGFGYDVHRLEPGADLWLGGIQIPSDRGAVGHSDADVLIHAICDALLGAANLRDIGLHFPNTDPKWKGADSKVLLKEVASLLHHKGWAIGNIDCTLALERPKISPYISEMQATLSKVLGLEEGAISIKATTNEALGYVGRREGACAYAVALIRQS